MIKAKKSTNAHRQMLKDLVDNFGTARHKKAYRSVIGNITGLGRKVQSLNDLLRNEQKRADDFEKRCENLTKELLFGGMERSWDNCSMVVDDGTRLLPLHGREESIKAAQRIILRDSNNRVAAHNLANHIAGAKYVLPEEWKDWAEELERDLRKIGNL